jgi:hypothetical protein
MLLPAARPGGVVQRVADQAHQHRVAAPTPLVVGRARPHELGAIGERAHDQRPDRSREPAEEVRPSGARRRDHLAAVEGAVPQEQRPTPDRAQQPLPGGPLVGVPGPDAGVADRVGAALAQGDELHPRPSAAAAGRRLAAERPHVGRRVGDVERGAVHRQQAQAEQEGTRGGRRGEGTADAPEEARQRPGPEAVAGLAQRPLAHAQALRLGPQPAQAADQPAEHVCQVVGRVQVHGDAEQEGHQRGQFARPRLRRPALRQHRGDRPGREDAGQGIQAEVAVEGVRLGDLAYHQGHALQTSS